MKKRTLFILTAFLCCIALVSCKKEETNNNGNNDNTNPQATGTVVNNAVTDVDGNHYNAVWIGGKLWMKENLRTKKYPNGTEIELGYYSSSSNPLRYAPNNDESNVPTYGYLYNWLAVMNGATSSTANPSGVQGICPNGWHVPSKAEWDQMLDHVNSQTQYRSGGYNLYIAKSLASTSGWQSSTSPYTVGNDQSANNATGFSAYPAGFVVGSPSFFGTNAEFWTATESETDANKVYSPYLFYNYASVNVSTTAKKEGLSLRCVRD